MNITDDSIYGSGVGKGSNFSDMDLVREYLGDPNPAILNVTAYDRYRTTNKDLPDAYRGRNAKMANRVALSYLTAESDWETTNAAPWAYMEDLTVEWEVKELGRELLEDVPHEGTSRYMQQSSYIERAVLGRAGLSFKMELDFYRTEKGRQNYKDNINQLAQAVQRTANLNTVFALLDCKTYEQMWIQKFGRATIDFMQRMTEEISNYCCTIKSEKAMDILVQKHINLLESHNIRPNILVLWPGAGMWFDMIGPSMDTLVHSIGKYDNLIEKRGVKAKQSFRDIPLFEAREYTHKEVNSGVHNLQLLARSRSVGEYYVMSTEAWRNSSPHSRQEFRTSDRDIWIYNENTDGWARISFIEAFKNGGLFDGHNDDSKYSKLLVSILKSWKDNAYDFEKQEVVQSGGVSGGTNNKPRPPHWLFHQLSSKDNKGKPIAIWKLATHLGQIHPQWISPNDWKRTFETVQDMLDGGDQNTRNKHQELIESAKRIVREMQAHEYNAAFWTELQRINPADNIQDTPEDLQEQWHQNVKGFQGTPQGSMRLPVTRVDDGNGAFDNAYKNGKYPPGYDNFPGFAEIATHEFADDDYTTIAKEIRPIVEFIQRLASTLQQLFPHSDAINVAHRRPWFHKADVATVLFETLVSKASHRPLFLNVNGEGSSEVVNPSAYENLPPFTFAQINQTEKNKFRPLANLINQTSKPAEALESEAYLYAGIFSDLANKQKFLDGVQNNIIILQKGEKMSNEDKKKISEFKQELTMITLAGKRYISDNDKQNAFATLLKNPAKTANNNNNVANWVRTPLTYGENLFKALKANKNVIAPGDPSNFDTVFFDLQNGSKYIRSKSRRDQGDDKLHSVFTDEEDNTKIRRKRLATNGYFASEISRNFGSKNNKNVNAKSKVSPIEQVDEEDDDDNRFGDEDESEDLFQINSKSKKLKTNIGAQLKKPLYPEDEKGNDYIPQDWTMNFHTTYQKAVSNPNFVNSAIGAVVAMNRCDHLGAWLTLMEHNVYLPIWILLARPNITHRVYSGILMQGGVETAINAYSHTNLMLGDDVKTKMFEGNYTTYMRTIVKDQEKVVIIEDCHPANYIGGHNVSWITKRDEIDFTTEQGKNKRNAKSLIAIVEPIATERVTLPVLSLAGRIDDSQNYNEQAANAYHFNSSEFVHVRFGLKSYSEMDINTQPKDTFPMLSDRPNFNLFQGTQFAWNPNARAFSSHKDCQGHLGRDGSQPGAASSWNGARQRLPTFRAQEHVLV